MSKPRVPLINMEEQVQQLETQLMQLEAELTLRKEGLSKALLKEPIRSIAHLLRDKAAYFSQKLNELDELRNTYKNLKEETKELKPDDLVEYQKKLDKLIDDSNATLGAYFKKDGKTFKALKSKYEKELMSDKEQSSQRVVKHSILNAILDYPYLTLSEIFFVVQQKQGVFKPTIEAIKESAKQGKLKGILSDMKKVLDTIEPGWFEAPNYGSSEAPTTPSPTSYEQDFTKNKRFK